jgi:hypothetical protein
LILKSDGATKDSVKPIGVKLLGVSRVAISYAALWAAGTPHMPNTSEHVRAAAVEVTDWHVREQGVTAAVLPCLAMAMGVKAQLLGGTPLDVTLDEILAAIDALAPAKPP